MTTEERRAHCRQIGHLGGTKTVQSRGKGYMRAIGSTGFAVTCQRHYSGNRALARAALAARGRMRPVRRIDPADELRRDLAEAA